VRNQSKTRARLISFVEWSRSWSCAHS